MLIRSAEEKDIPGILELLRQVCNVHQAIRPDIFCPDAAKYDEAALKTLLTDETKPIFVAVRGNFVAGYCFCQLRRCQGGAMVPRTEIYIDDLCVEEKCRGQGIAAALYGKALDYARHQGCAFVTLNVWQGNEAAMKFYEKCGLTPRSTMMEMPLEDKKC